jgi:hypothetical protein
MGTRRPQTMAKRARELALQEKRERKRQKKAEAAHQREIQNVPSATERTVDQLESSPAGDPPSSNDP